MFYHYGLEVDKNFRALLREDVVNEVNFVKDDVLLKYLLDGKRAQLELRRKYEQTEFEMELEIEHKERMAKMRYELERMKVAEKYEKSEIALEREVEHERKMAKLRGELERLKAEFESSKVHGFERLNAN